MEKVEYGDVNKFLVSIGVVLIGLSFLVPYLYLKEDFGLYIEASKMAGFPASIQELLHDKQSKVSFMQQWVPWISAGLFLLGSTSSIYGLCRWFTKQGAIDDKLKKEIEKLALEIKALTPMETIEKAIQETEEILQAEQSEQEIEDPVETGVIERVVLERRPMPHIESLKIESRIFQLFQEFKSPNFEMLPGQRLGNKYEVDMLLKANSPKYSDRIIEIKYFRNHLISNVILQTILNLNMVVAYYKQTINKNVVPVLLIIYDEKVLGEYRIPKMKEEFQELTADLKNIKRLRLEFIRKDEIEQFEVKGLLKANP